MTIEAQVTRAFNSSVEVYVQVYTADIKGLNNQRSNHAFFTFVALDDKTMKPITIPPVVVLTQEEITLYEGAERRRELRLILSGRMKVNEATQLKKYINS